MENIAIFMLVGLSLFGNGYCVGAGADANVQSNDAPKPIECVTNAVQRSYKLYEQLAGYLCAGKSKEELEESLKAFLMQISCPLDGITGISHKDIASGSAPTVTNTLEAFKPTLEGLGLTGSNLNLICKLLTQTQCLKDLLTNAVPDALLNTPALAQQIQCAVNGEGGLNLEALRKALSGTACTLDGILDKVLKGKPNAFFNKFITKHLENLLNGILSDEHVKDTLDPLLCVPANLLGGLGGGKGKSFGLL